MKRKFMKRVYLLICMLTVMAITVKAEDYPIKIADGQVTSLNAYSLNDAIEGVKGDVTYDHASKTLRMNNALIVSSIESGFGIYSSLDSLTIDVTGNCFIESEQWTAIATGSVAIKGTGSLTLKGIRGICAINQCKTIDVKDGVTLVIDASYHGIDGLSFYPMVKVSGKNTRLIVKGDVDAFLNISALNLAEGLHITQPSVNAKFKNRTIKDENGNVATFVKISNELLSGDANGDDAVTMADANAVVNCFLNSSATDGFNYVTADVNGDSNITMADANAIVNMFLSGEYQLDPYNGHEYVDLGLSVKWATCNVGATTPYETGNYFAWGETSTKSYYAWSTYRYITDGGHIPESENTFVRYSSSDGKTVLDTGDDVASVKWGGNWRMPTREDLDELLDANNCKWVWKTSPVPGYKVTSLKEGYKDKYIFLPATGMITLDGGPYTDMGCYYWTSSLKSNSPSFVYILIGMNSNGNNIYRCDQERRFPGLAVRPVCP